MMAVIKPQNRYLKKKVIEKISRENLFWLKSVKPSRV